MLVDYVVAVRTVSAHLAAHSSGKRELNLR